MTASTDNTWYSNDATVGGGVGLTSDYDGPPGFEGSSLALTTNSHDTARAQLLTAHDVFNQPLSSVDGVDYWTYHDRASPGFADGNASIQLQIDTNGFGTSGGFTTLVYEPYNTPGNTVEDDAWQFWDATGGDWWTTNRIECGTFVVEEGNGGAPFTTPADGAAGCPDTRVLQTGLSIGSGASGLIVAADGLHITTTEADYTWNFGPK